MNSENPRKAGTPKQSEDNDQNETTIENTVPILTIEDDAVLPFQEALTPILTTLSRLRGAIKIRIKLVVLGSLAGIFFWLWIVATIATAYFLYRALANDATWSILIYSAGISLIAKCLAVAFDDQKKRGHYVDQLIERGHTHAAATEAWKITKEGGTNLLLNLKQTETIAESDLERN